MTGGREHGEKRPGKREEPMKGFYGRILRIYLSDKRFSVDSVEPDVFEAYLGGKGLASFLLSEFNPPGVDPLR